MVNIMKNNLFPSFKDFSLIFILLILFYCNSNTQPVKRVLLEQFTSTTCGWCPDGTVYLDSLIKKYPDQVIGAKMHYADAMETSETHQMNLAYVLANAGWPSGAINRQYVYEYFIPDSMIALDRGIWDSVVAAELQKPPVVDVNLYYNINKDTRKLVATVTGKFLSEINGDLRFNVSITEDDVTGTGSGYDQINNYSHNSQFPNHPYYNLPSVIKGYKHQMVLRKMLGSPWGTGGAIPKHVVSGDYFVQNYEYDLDTLWNLDKLKFIGFVQTYDPDTNHRQILNSVIGQPAEITARINTPAQINDAKGQNETFESSASLVNLTNTSRTYIACIYKSLRTPEDWTAQIITTPNEFNLMPGDSASVQFSLTTGTTIGIGDAIIYFREKDNDSSLSYGMSVTVLSNGVEKINVYDDNDRETGGFFSIAYNIKQSGRNNFIDVPSDVVTQNIDKLNNLKTVSWNCGEMGEINLDESKALEKLVDNNVNLMMSGTIWIDGLSSNNPTLLQKMGLSYETSCFQGWRDGIIYLTGVPGDPIGNGFYAKSRLMSFYSEAQKIVGANTYPVLKHRNTDTVVATRTQLDKSRLVLLGINPGLFDTLTVENKLIRRSLDWLEGVTDVFEPESPTNGRISLNISQNPVSETAILDYDIQGMTTNFLEISIMDLSGRNVQILENKNIFPGKYQTLFDAGNLNPGMYFIVARSGMEQAVLPVVVVK
jgi:thiol-disulfide isomerase/thioredoxin